MKAEQNGRRSTLPTVLGRLRVALDDAFARASQDLGLSAQQAELLCAVIRPAAIGEIALALRCDRSNVSRLVDRGSLRGLLRRTEGEEDGRVTMVELTPAGSDLAVRFIADLEAQTQDLRERWPSNREKLAVELLNEVSEVLDASTPRRPKNKRRRVEAT
ncbi:MAG: MarR family winged helix-turn-helix transcriptional regulator [Candidatus Dormibacteraceae bacterium]